MLLSLNVSSVLINFFNSESAVLAMVLSCAFGVPLIMLAVISIMRLCRVSDKHQIIIWLPLLGLWLLGGAESLALMFMGIPVVKIFLVVIVQYLILFVFVVTNLNMLDKLFCYNYKKKANTIGNR